MKIVIDKEAEITKLEDMLANLTDDKDKQSVRFAINVIEGFEEIPKGEWVGGEIGYCSICGSKGCASDIWNGCKDGMYCPNCGADMRKEA